MLSLAAAGMWRSSVRQHERETFHATAQDVGEKVEILMRRDTDFVMTLRALLTMRPGLGQSEFGAWYRELEGPTKEAGSIGTALVRPVRASQLGSFLAERRGDGAFRAVVKGKIVGVAPGRGPYCLMSSTVAMKALDEPLAHDVQGDWCLQDTPLGGVMAPIQKAAADSGEVLVFRAALPQPTTFFETAVYRRGARLRTVAQRRSALTGWIVSTFDTHTMIQRAIGQHSHLSLALYHSDPGGPPLLIDSAGSSPGPDPHGFRESFSVSGSWSSQIIGTVPASGLSAWAQALLVLVGGTLAASLLAALALVLGRSRERAYALVRERTSELRHQALHDALTGLPNRALALDRAAQTLAISRRRGVPAAALYVDVDGFKHINDTFGHAAGDLVLKTVAERLRSAIRESDTAARLGGDEFLVLIEDATEDAAPERVAQRVLEALRRPYEVETEIGHRLSLTASVGIASGLRDSAEELVRDADLALYRVKATHRGGYAAFEPAMEEAARHRMTLEMDLAEALERDELFLHYQPIFDLRTEDVTSVEALLRWQHPRLGLLAPSEFIGLAEDSGLIVPIGRWVLHEACRAATRWHAGGFNVGIAVNVSARQLDTDQLLGDVREALATSSLDPTSLTLEVTETGLMRDPSANANRLRLLRELGVRIAVDDFGTGYSSLAYLYELPVDAVKIDRTFVTGIATSNQSAAFVRALVQLGKALNLETLAEGIEDRDQLSRLQREHCDLGQGFLLSRPLDTRGIETFLRASRPARAPSAAHS